MSKSKGRYYEQSLIKEFRTLGHESWAVPLSGAIGESDLCTLPDRVKKYLVGDVCVNIAGRDFPIEVKYRANGAGFTQLQSNSISNIRLSGSTKYALLFSITDLCAYLTKPTKLPISNSKLSQSVIDWLDQVNILALKSYRSPWIFVVRI